jgi:hypothetical protein
MWLETLAAIIFLGGLFPIWFPASVIYALGTALLAFIMVAFSLAQHGGASSLVLVLAPVDEAFKAFVAIPSWGWSWAKFEHPVWAWVISMVSIAVLSNGN